MSFSYITLHEMTNFITEIHPSHSAAAGVAGKNTAYVCTYDSMFLTKLWGFSSEKLANKQKTKSFNF